MGFSHQRLVIGEAIGLRVVCVAWNSGGDEGKAAEAYGISVAEGWGARVVEAHGRGFLGWPRQMRDRWVSVY
jgi:phage terminase large subunit GpA-like protein